MVEDTSIMTNSICKSCFNRVCRLIIPPDYYWEEVGDGMEDGIDRENQIIEHNYCKDLEIPLDHIVLDCNRFVPIEEVVIIQNEEMIGS